MVFFVLVPSSFEGERVRAYVIMTGDGAPPLESRGRHYQQQIGTAGAVTRPGLTRDWGRGELGPLKHPRHLCPMVKCDSSGCRTRCWLDAGGDRGEGGNTASLKHLRHLRGDLWAASRQPPASCGPLLPARFSCGQKLFT